MIKGRLEVSEVTYTYDGAATPALDRVSFTVEEGQMIGVVGRSGSGKTTITRLLQGIQNPQQGLINNAPRETSREQLHSLYTNALNHW